MPCKCARYDAAQHRILSHQDMLKYFAKDARSLEIVMKHMPHRYVVYPIIEIRISTQDARSITIYQIYPGETRDRVVELNDRQLNGLRRTWKQSDTWKRDKIGEGYLRLRKEGCVRMDPLKRFGLWTR